MTWNKRDTIICITLACIAGFLFVPFLGSVHLFEGEEMRSAEIAREMIITGDYFRTHRDFQPSWENPPFFYWLQVVSMKIFGINEFAARFPNALLGMLMLPLLYALGKNLSGRGNVGILWALCYIGSIFPALSHKVGFPDPWSNMWVLLSVYALSGYYASPKGKVHSMRRIALAGAGIGMALLTNGAAAVVFVIVLWLLFWFVRRSDEEFPLTEFAVFCAIALAASLLWYGTGLARGGLWFFREFVQYHLHHFSASNTENWRGDYVLLLMFGCFPAIALIFPALQAFWQSRTRLSERDALTTFTLWMVLLFVGALLVGIIVKTEIMRLSTLIYFPVTFLAARSIDGLLRKDSALSRIITAFTIGLGVLWMGILICIPLLGMNTAWMLEHTQSVFFRASLQANVHWSAWEFLIAGGFALAFLVSLYFLRKQRYFEMVFTLFPATVLTTLFFFITIAPNVEGYTQAAAIEFYKGLRGESCYIQTLGFTTSADLFYAQKQPAQSASALNIPPEEFETWLLEDNIDHTTYFVCKIQDAAVWRKHPNLTELYEKNGFVFFKREPKKKLNLARRSG
jgi:4-amino-4-deoxy-L-arabinose transferase-like glycosyltransferase